MHRLIGKAIFERILGVMANGFAIALLAVAATQTASAQITITNLTPSTIPEGSPQFNLLVTLSQNLPLLNGVPPAVLWNTVPLQTTIVNPNQLQAVVTPILVGVPSTAQVAVQIATFTTPSVPFVVTGPVITSLQPAAIVAGSPAFTLTINGSGFLLVGGVYAPLVDFGATTNLQSTFISSTQLQVTIPAPAVASPGNVNVVVNNQDVSISPPFSFTIFAPLQILTQAMATGTTNSPYDFTFQTANGIPPLSFAATGLPGTLTLNSATGEITGTPKVAANYTVSLTVMDSMGQTASGLFRLTINNAPPPPLRILSQAMATGTANSPYDFTFQTVNGIPPLTFTAAGLPATLSLNSATGEITGTPNVVANYTVSLTVTDSTGQTAGGQFPLNILAPKIVPLQFNSGTLPAGQVGVAYSAAVGAIGGTAPYVFNLVAGSGSPPAGLTFGSNGSLNGTPTAAGVSKFSVQVQDAAGASVTQSFSVIIAPPLLSVGAGALSNSPAGAAVNIAFTASGGNPPYTFSADSGIPPGTTLNSNGTLTGTPTTPGTYRFVVTVRDSSGATAGQTFSITIVPPGLTILAITLPNGQVGVAYAAQFYAANGQPPYGWAATGGPAGIAMSGTGQFSGIPTADGTFTVSVTVTDAAGNQAKQTYTLTIAPAALAITTTVLPAGVSGTAYSATLAATGGDGPYTWTAQGLPSGITLSAGGVLSGAAVSAGTYTVTATVTDSKGVTASRPFILTVTAVPLAITTPSLPNGTVQSAYSVTLTASGGAGSNKWAATGLPAGLTMSAGGTISGTPTVPGSSVVVVTVTDSAGTVGVQTYKLNIFLPATPPVNFSSLPATANPSTQPGVQVGLATAYPLPVTATLTLTFTPDSGGDDPAVQFSTGGRTTAIVIPAGVTAPVGSVALQTGTVAGTITITAQLSASGQDITPSPAPKQTVRIAAMAPSIASVTAVRTSTGFTVTVIGFSTPRQVTQAAFQFAGAGLQTSSLAIPATSLFSAWYANTASAPFGSQFGFVQPFTVTGNLLSVTSVTVTLTNDQGTSAAATANLQ